MDKVTREEFHNKLARKVQIEIPFSNHRYGCKTIITSFFAVFHAAVALCKRLRR